MKRTSSASYLDRKIQLAKVCVGGPGLCRESAEQIFGDVQAMFDQARDRRQYSEPAFVERCKNLIGVVAKLRPALDGKPAQDAGALEDVLLTFVTAGGKL